MKICVTCIYWMLLLMSIFSNAFLLLITALEDAQAKNYPSSLENNTNFGIYDNITLDNATNSYLNTSSMTVIETQKPSVSKTDYKNHYYQSEFSIASPSRENVNEDKQNDKNALEDMVTESSQQPNLYQGIPKSGEVIADTVVTDLHSLTETKINSDFSKKRSLATNSSLSINEEKIEYRSKELSGDDTLTTQIPSPPTIDDVTERPKNTNIPDENILIMKKSVVEETPEVVVVRAEQNPIIANDFEFVFRDKTEEVLSEEVSDVEDAFTTASEPNDTDIKVNTEDEVVAIMHGDEIVTPGPTDPHEDIPSFSEWAQKRLEEAEKKKSRSNASVHNSNGQQGRGVTGMKVRSKNYASPDCGAKVTAANSEARGVKNVLVSTMDEYMLNTCTSRIWFVVELCEAIQAKKVELANFELFSSSPKDFSVYISDRFPTRDWNPVGQFTAIDTKDIQSFALHPHIFGKFIKVELHSYYGSEHFCPISLFRAYGTSEFEVLETETENQLPIETTSDVDDEEDNEEEELSNSDTREHSGNLFGSAKDAVLSIVKKAAEILVKSSDLTGNNITQIQQSIDSGNVLENSYATCTTPRYTILCGNCSDEKFAKVFQLVSCRERQLEQLLKIDLISRSLRENGLCAMYNVRVDGTVKKDKSNELKYFEETKNQNRRRFDTVRNFELMFLTSIFKSEYIMAICNVLATEERKVVINTSYEMLVSNDADNGTTEHMSHSKVIEQDKDGTQSHTHTTVASTESSPSTYQESRRGSQEAPDDGIENVINAAIEISPNSESVSTRIKSTKTLGREDIKKEPSVPILEPSKEFTEEMQAEMLTTVPPTSNIASYATSKIKVSVEPSSLATPVETISQATTSIPVSTADRQESSNSTVELDAVSSEVSDIQNKIDKLEQNLNQDVKQIKADTGEQEMKLSSQDSLALDTLLSDLKDLENEAVSLQNGPASSSSSMTQPTASTTPQKESVFLRLSNRIKTLERNMSLLGEYLEELSRRYKKQVEELQRSLERVVSTVSEISRKIEERESEKSENIAALSEQVAIALKSVENILYDRDSWRGKFTAICQYVLLICLEVFLALMFLTYCRRKFEKGDQLQSISKKDVTRRKSAENFASHSKKAKKRRPSEIASHITGTCRELMIDDKSSEKKEKKKKRKRESSTTGHKTVVDTNTKGDLTIIRYKSVPNVNETGESSKISPAKRTLSVEVPKTDKNLAFSVPETMSNWYDERINKTYYVTSSEDTNSAVESGKFSNFTISSIGDQGVLNSVLECTDITNPRSSGGILKSA